MYKFRVRRKLSYFYAPIAVNIDMQTQLLIWMLISVDLKLPD